jgi:hypothetical protein
MTISVPPSEPILELLWSVEAKVNNLDLNWDYLQKMDFVRHGDLRPEQWEKLEPFLAEEAAVHERVRLKQHLRRAISESVISDWVAAHVDIKKSSDAILVKSRIRSYLLQNRQDELKLYLEDVLGEGIKKAEKTYKKEQRSGGYALHAWALTTGIVKLVIAFGILSVASSRFETIVFAVLVLTYISLNAAYRYGRYYIRFTTVAIDNRFSGMFRALEIQSPCEDEAQIAVQRQTNSLPAAVTVPFWISEAFDAVITLFAVWKLISSIFF